uniref:Aldedh domain-containing protein n=1 Tax=Steinernema glaseri TaxID=37863 RepID=A0A1I8AA73_9BILA
MTVLRKSRPQIPFRISPRFRDPDAMPITVFYLSLLLKRAMAFHDVISAQRDYFNTGETKKIETRKELLRTLKKAIQENEELLCDGVYNDLKRKQKVTYNLEVSSALAEIDYMIDNIAEWAAPHYVEKTFLTALDTPMIVKDPKGVVLIVSPWNYPVSMVLLPMINILAADLLLV